MSAIKVDVHEVTSPKYFSPIRSFALIETDIHNDEGKSVFTRCALRKFDGRGSVGGCE